MTFTATARWRPQRAITSLSVCIKVPSIPLITRHTGAGEFPTVGVISYTIQLTDDSGKNWARLMLSWAGEGWIIRSESSATTSPPGDRVEVAAGHSYNAHISVYSMQQSNCTEWEIGFDDFDNTILHAKLGSLWNCTFTYDAQRTDSPFDLPPNFAGSFQNIHIMEGHMRIPEGSPTPSITVNDASLGGLGQDIALVSRDSCYNDQVNFIHGTIGLPSIAAASWADNRLDVFAVASPGNCMHKYWGDTNRDWSKPWDWANTYAFSAPVAVAKAAERLDVVYLGDNSQILHLGWNPGWSTADLGGKFLGVPALVTMNPTRVDVFGVDQTTGSLLHKKRDGTTWDTSWEVVPVVGAPAHWRSSPAVCSWGPNRMDVAIIGDKDAMYYNWWSWTGSPFSGWSIMGLFSLGGQFASPPSIVSCGPGRIDFFGVGRNKHVLHKSWNEKTWTPSIDSWEDLGGPVSSCVQAVSVKAGEIHLFALGANHTLCHRIYPTGTSWVEVSNWRLNSAPRVTQLGKLEYINVFALGPRNEVMIKSMGKSLPMWTPGGSDWAVIGENAPSVDNTYPRKVYPWLSV